ncbi:MAG TPA: TonB-dependent receptor [Vicinamibacteria bacterium]|nr:TonB-dependent receptor [Vicinamibacteria bacterium]
MTISTRIALIAAIAFQAAPSHLLAQASAVNASIEGVIKDATGGVLPGVSVTVTNLDTGASRTVVTNETGLYRAQLLPLGTYRVMAELSGFSRFTQEGVELSAGMTATVNVTLQVGEVTETITVGADSPVIEPAKMDLGRLLDEREIRNIPLVSRNPFNFALLQANVTGYENEEFGVPRVNANGTQMRTNYQIDGNTNTQKDRPGLRLQPISEIFVKEVQVVTSGLAPEFGQTTGMVFNVVTPSGTNQYSGTGSYRFRRQGMSARPFTLSESAPKPDTKVDNFTGTFGGPIRRDAAHFYVGYEYIKRDLSADRVITVDPADAARLGISDTLGDGVIPAQAEPQFFIVKGDFQLNPSHSLSARYTLFDQPISSNIGGGLNTLERAVDFADSANSVSAQLVSSFGGDKLNELRGQWSNRKTDRVRNDFSGSMPAITISGVANFGGVDGDNFEQKIFQITDSFTLYRGNHAFKFGGSIEAVDDFRRSSVDTTYTFGSIAAYEAARDGIDPFAYTTFAQNIGDPTLSFDSTFFSAYFQDDWSVNDRLKVLYGVRYDYYRVPDAVPAPNNPASQEFRIDKNNFAPRVGVSWDTTGEGKAVLTFQTGVMTDAPHLRIYLDAIQQNGDPKFTNFVLNPTSAGAPAFPGALPAGAGFFSSPSTIYTVSPDFRSEYSVQNTVQYRRALQDDLSFELAYVNAFGRNIPLTLDVNLINPTGSLDDGRPVFATAVNGDTRANPAFNHIRQYESIGESSYNAFTVRLRKRLSRDLSLNTFYTLAKAEDDAILQGLIIGSRDPFHSDPTDNGRDKGRTPFDVRHTWISSGVWTLPTETQLGFVVNLNSGLPFNIRSNRDVNGDGQSTNDRPVGVDRMDRNLGTFFQADFRFSQFFPLSSDRYRLEVFGDFLNLFNRDNVRERTETVTIDSGGNAVAPIPADDEFRISQGYQNLQFQLGLKLHF